jgi:hypothetical protein
MRRTDREKDRAFALDVIDRCEYGVAAFATGDGVPYCIPLSLARVGEELYFHCALEGTKLDLLRANPAVCISFVASNVAAKDKFTTYYQSAVVVGTAYEILEDSAKVQALRALCQKLTPDNMPAFDRAIEQSLSRTGVWGIHIQQVTGKEKAQK